MTLEEELALLKTGGNAPAPTSQPATAPEIAPAPELEAPAPVDADSVVPAQDAPEPLEIQPDPGDDMPELATNLPSLANAEPAGTWENMSAAWVKDTITRDRRGEHSNMEKGLAWQMFTNAPPEVRARIAARSTKYSKDWAPFIDLVIDEIARDVPNDPGRYGEIPLTRAAFDEQIIKQQKAALEEAKAVLDRPGGLITEFLGEAASTMASPTQAALMVAGGGAGSALRIIATEMAIGGLSEAVDLPSQYAAAERLGEPEPDALSQIGFGAIVSGGLAGAIVGATRFPSFARQVQGRHAARRDAAVSARPEGVDKQDAEIAVDQAEADLRGDTNVQDVVNPEPEPGTLGAILSTGAGFSDVLEAGKGFTTVRGPDGQALRREGTRAWRNNNPGNIEYGPFARSQGAVGSDGRFAVFPTYEAGRAAKTRLLWGSKGYRGMTIGQAINRYAPPFENNTTSYAATVARAAGASTATPMAQLTPAQRSLMLDAMERVEGFRPGKENGVAAPAPRRGLAPTAGGGDVPNFGPTSRGYTETGQVTAGDGFRIDVSYEVVDLSTLFRATGDFQPRDRSRIGSDAQIAAMAASLDPVQLMPGPMAAHGAPIVGPNNMIESGNGRYGAIERAYARHPDRADAYRAQVEAAGYAIPEGVERPVLIARRTTELSDSELKRFTLNAQDSGVAAMTPVEVARASSQAMTAPALHMLDPTQPLTSAANGSFVRNVLAALPRSARNAMFGADGTLNKEGARQLREAMFARAWPDPDILARYTETDAGELKTLLDALETAAPSWATLKAEIEAGLVRPEMDISDFILDAMRLIGTARDVSARGGPSIGNVITELLDEVDLLEGAISPLTAAMVRKFWKNGRAAKADDVAGFLTRYAEDARKVGGTDTLLAGPTPRDVLTAIDNPTFGSLPQEMGTARGYAQPQPKQIDALETEGFDGGASSPEAQAADAQIVADFTAPRADIDDTPTAARVDPVDEAAAEMAEQVDQLRARFDDMEIEMPDGTSVNAREMLDDLLSDTNGSAVLQGCGLTPTGVSP